MWRDKGEPRDSDSRLRRGHRTIAKYAGSLSGSQHRGVDWKEGNERQGGVPI